MPSTNDADTIRILVSTDNHVGYNERDAIRGDDSWRSFDEVMCLAKEHEVDMVLLAGDLFHENKPSRKSMFQVMRSLRMNCLGDKPCELEMLSDASEAFQGAFNHVNYEDPDINIAIPVFSIHGNHDDPSGEGHLAALDILQTAGLVNYYGRTPESDNIVIRPVLFQKGRTKLALYGMSNVRDERLFRTFRDHGTHFFRPVTQRENWFNLLSVHQNHHKYSETGYLPENFLPDYMDLVVWGHEHECLIDPRYNPVMNFHVMQPGSSVATSLMPGEAVPKHVSLLSITGREFTSQKIRLKSVRPFVMREIVLQDEKGMKSLAKKDNNRGEVNRHLESIVNEMIEEAKAAWLETQEGEEDDVEMPLPLIRLRVEYTAPEGGKYDCENPQRFSNRFIDRVANQTDVVQFHRKKRIAKKTVKADPDLPSESALAQLSIDNIKVEKLVREFLTAQSLTILPQNSFGDAVGQFVDKDDRHALELFLNESLSSQIDHLVKIGQVDEDDITSAMGQHKSTLEELFAAGHLKRAKKGKLKDKPDYWDSDVDGSWADQPGAMVISDGDPDALSDIDQEETSVPTTKKRAPAKSNARGGSASRGKVSAAPAKKATASRSTKPRKAQNGDSDGSDVIMIDDDDDFAPARGVQSRGKTGTRAASRTAASPATRTSGRTPANSQTARQTTLSFGKTPSSAPSGKAQTAARELSVDEISDDSDAFEPVATSKPVTRSKR